VEKIRHGGTFRTKGSIQFYEIIKVSQDEKKNLNGKNELFLVENPYLKSS